MTGISIRRFLPRLALTAHMVAIIPILLWFVIAAGEVYAAIVSFPVVSRVDFPAGASGTDVYCGWASIDCTVGSPNQVTVTAFAFENQANTPITVRLRRSRRRWPAWPRRPVPPRA